MYEVAVVSRCCGRLAELLPASGGSDSDDDGGVGSGGSGGGGGSGSDGGRVGFV